MSSIYTQLAHSMFTARDTKAPQPQLQIDRDLLSQLHSCLDSLNDMLSRLHFQVAEIKTETKVHGSLTIAEEAANEDRRSTLIRRATHSILESAGRNHH